MRNVVSTFLLLLTVLSCTACSGSYSAMFQRYLKDGLAEMEHEQYGQAENSLQLAVTQSNHAGITEDERILALRSLGVCQQAQGKHAEAVKEFDKVLILLAKKNALASVQYAEVLEDTGISYCKMRMFPKAEKDLNDALATYESQGVKDKQLGRVLQSLAYSQQKCGDDSSAVKSYARYFASQNLNKQSSASDLLLLNDYRKILSRMHNKIELAKTDTYLKKLSSKA